MKMAQSEIEQAMAAGMSWLYAGTKTKKGLPVHPEYLYRRSGTWQGWNDFLGVDKKDTNWKKNIQRDKIENFAWKYYANIEIQK